VYPVEKIEEALSRAGELNSKLSAAADDDIILL
jgi:hypothetical protein